jgi:hypothetical protein
MAAQQYENGTVVTVNHCHNFPDLDGLAGIVQRADHYDDGTIEYVVRFPDLDGDWDWVKHHEVSVQ